MRPYKITDRWIATTRIVVIEGIVGSSNNNNNRNTKLVDDFDGRASILGSRKSLYFLFSSLPTQRNLSNAAVHMIYHTHTRARTRARVYIALVLG